MAKNDQLKRIADALEKNNKFFDNPEEIVDRLVGALQSSLARVSVPVVTSVPPAVEGGTPAHATTPLITGVEVKLSEEERKAICDQALADVVEQMDEFKGFIGQALSELPAPTLKRIGELMKKGEKFKLRRRHGCIYLDFGKGDDDFYIRM